MRRLGLAGLVLGAAAAVGILGAADAGASSESAAGAEGGGRTGNLIAFVRSPGIGPGSGGPKRQARLGAARDRIAALLERTHLDAVHSIPDIGAVSVRPGSVETLAWARRDLEADPAVTRVEAEHYATLRYLPNDPALVRHDTHAPADDFYQWNLRKEGFPRAWKRSRGKRAKLAVIDTGMDGGHFDLSGRIVRAKGYDYPDCGGFLEPPCTGPKHDEVGHGTHVAGLACGDGNNGRGIAGAAFACRLIDEKATDSETLTDSLAAKSITDATDHGADVISMSFGGPNELPATGQAINYAFRHGVVLVAAASNESVTEQGFPAEYLQPTGTAPNIRSGRGLVVTAAGHNDRRAWFRPGHGEGVSLAAYGSASSACEIRSDCGIFSSFPRNTTEIEEGNPIFGEPGCGNCRTSFDGSNDWAYVEGTSMATPQVAGAAALVRSERRLIKNKRVVRIIKRTASRDHFTEGLGWGILNAGRAVRRAAR